MFFVRCSGDTSDRNLFEGIDSKRKCFKMAFNLKNISQILFSAHLNILAGT